MIDFELKLPKETKNEFGYTPSEEKVIEKQLTRPSPPKGLWKNFVKASEPTTIEDLLDQYDYVRDLVGSEHLGVGSDIDLYGYDDMPKKEYDALKANYKGSYAFREKIDIEGVDHPKRMFDLTEGLVRRGYSNSEIRGILGQNFKRVLTKIWKD